MVLLHRGPQTLTFFLIGERNDGGGAAACSRSRATGEIVSQFGVIEQRLTEVDMRVDTARPRALISISPFGSSLPSAAIRPPFTPISQTKTSAAVPTRPSRITRSYAAVISGLLQHYTSDPGTKSAPMRGLEAAAINDETGAPARASTKAKAHVLFTITLHP
jgi:hypothetical protein